MINEIETTELSAEELETIGGGDGYTGACLGGAAVGAALGGAGGAAAGCAIGMTMLFVERKMDAR